MRLTPPPRTPHLCSRQTTYWETFAQAPELISGDYHVAQPNTTSPTRVPWSWSGTTSLCHPWGAGPAHWMSLNLLGVKPVAAGFARWEVRPLLAASLMRVTGVVPTVRGNFEVSFDLDLNEANVTVPSGIKAVGRVGIPLIAGGKATATADATAPPRLAGLTVNGSRVAVVGMGGKDDSGVYWVEGLGVGTHELRWRMSSKQKSSDNDGASPSPPPPSPFPFPKPATYAMKFTQRDDTTKGDWQGTYGANGYHFFHFCASAPGFTSSSTCAVAKETQSAELRCGGAANTIKAVTFAGEERGKQRETREERD